MQPGATRPVGVTEEHLLGQKTAGFRGVAPGFLCGAICSRSLMPNARLRLPGRRFPTRRPRTEGVISAVIRQPGCNHTLARPIDRPRSFQTRGVTEPRACSESTASDYHEGGSTRGQAVPSTVSRNREKRRMARGRPRKQREQVVASANGGATTGYEAELWSMADALRGTMDAAEYKHVVLGLIFLKYISDAFEERRAAVLAEWGEDAAEDRDEYVAENIFWVPAEARWTHLRAQARQPTVGLTVDQAMAAIERDNPALKDVLPRDYARQALDKRRLGQLIDLVSNITDRGRGRPFPRRARPCLRVLPVAVRERRGQEGRRVLHAALRGQGAGGDAGAVPGPGLRPVLRVVGHVRAVDRVHPRSRQRERQRRQGQGGHQHLRSGVELHDVAAREDEPRHPGHRGPDRPRRQLSRRPAPGPEGRLHPRQPAVQRLGLGRRAAGRRQALALRGAAEGQRQLRLGAAHGPPSGPGRLRWVRAREWVDVVEPVGRGRYPEEPDRGGPGGLHGRAAGPALLFDADSGLPLVPGATPAAPRRGAVHRRPQAGPDGGPHAPRVDRRGHRPHRRRLPRLARRRGRLRRPFRASARAPRSTRCAGTATC